MRLNRRTGLDWTRHADTARFYFRERAGDELLLRQALDSGRALAAGKIGTTELMVLEFFDRYIQLPWPARSSWHRPAQRLHECSGFFPVQKHLFSSWHRTYLDSLAQMDFLAQWQTPGSYLAAYEVCALRDYAGQAKRVLLAALHPVHPPASWLLSLCKKRWLVIHPFGQTIRHQLNRLGELGVYPETCREYLPRVRETCRVLPCPQFSYMVPPRHRDWFHALEDLQGQMAQESFDILLVGAGAWSLPLAVHAKRLGKQALHLGGQLQLLFGIEGGRWDKSRLYNKAWTRPLPEDRPPNFQLMEQGAYW